MGQIKGIRTILKRLKIDFKWPKRKKGKRK